MPTSKAPNHGHPNIGAGSTLAIGPDVADRIGRATSAEFEQIKKALPGRPAPVWRHNPGKPAPR